MKTVSMSSSETGHFERHTKRKIQISGVSPCFESPFPLITDGFFFVVLLESYKENTLSKVARKEAVNDQGKLVECRIGKYLEWTYLKLFAGGKCKKNKMQADLKFSEARQCLPLRSVFQPTRNGTRSRSKRRRLLVVSLSLISEAPS